MVTIRGYRIRPVQESAALGATVKADIMYQDKEYGRGRDCYEVYNAGVLRRISVSGQKLSGQLLQGMGNRCGCGVSGKIPDGFR